MFEPWENKLEKEKKAETLDKIDVRNLYFIWRYAELTCRDAKHSQRAWRNFEFIPGFNKTTYICSDCYIEAIKVSDYILRATAVKH